MEAGRAGADRALARCIRYTIEYRNIQMAQRERLLLAPIASIATSSSIGSHACIHNKATRSKGRSMVLNRRGVSSCALHWREQ